MGCFISATTLVDELGLDSARLIPKQMVLKCIKL